MDWKYTNDGITPECTEVPFGSTGKMSEIVLIQDVSGEYHLGYFLQHENFKNEWRGDDDGRLRYEVVRWCYITK